MNPLSTVSGIRLSEGGVSHFVWKAVCLDWLSEVGFFIKVVADILNIVPELESLQKELFRLRYDFSKLRVCSKKFCRSVFWVFDPAAFLLKSVHFSWVFEVVVFIKVIVHMLNTNPEFESLNNEFCRLSYDFPKLRVCNRKYCISYYFSVCSFWFQWILSFKFV